MCVVDVTGAAAVRPRSIDFASDATISQLHWRGWGQTRTVGAGMVQTRGCSPSCAGGATARLAGAIVLAGMKTCGGRRYYAGARVRLPSVAAGRQPVSFIKAPC